jgi:hypothetical protein
MFSGNYNSIYVRPKKIKNICVSADIIEKNKVDRYVSKTFYFCLGYTGQESSINSACPKNGNKKLA